MKILTKEIIKKLPKLYANENKKPEDVQVIFKMFVPWGAHTWYITEGEQRDGDWILFGYVTGVDFPELGYVSLNELMSIRGPGGLKIERDIHFGPCTLASVMEAEG